MSKIFFDANVLLDLLIVNRANHLRALHALPIISEQYETLVTSEDILTTVEYIATRQHIPCQKISAFFAMLRREFEIRNFTSVLSKALPVYAQKCDKGEKVDFEDLLQLYCALDAGCEVFLTEDKGIDGSNWDMQIVSLNMLG